MKNQSTLAILAFLLGWLTACKTDTISPAPVPTPSSPTISSSKTPVNPAPSPITPSISKLKAVDWSQLKQWEQDTFLPAWSAFLQSCNALRNQPLWRNPAIKQCNQTAQWKHHQALLQAPFHPTSSIQSGWQRRRANHGLLWAIAKRQPHTQSSISLSIICTARWIAHHWFRRRLSRAQESTTAWPPGGP